MRGVEFEATTTRPGSSATFLIINKGNLQIHQDYPCLLDSLP